MVRNPFKYSADEVLKMEYTLLIDGEQKKVPVSIKTTERQHTLNFVGLLLSLLLNVSFVVVGLIVYLIKAVECDRPLAFYALVFGIAASIRNVLDFIFPDKSSDNEGNSKAMNWIYVILSIVTLVCFIIFNVQTFRSVVCDAFLHYFCYWGIITVYLLQVVLACIGYHFGYYNARDAAEKAILEHLESV
ncbi:hypothetical protein RCL1_008495 [Eukaryota sp. TZLM3-RCL]